MQYRFDEDPLFRQRRRLLTIFAGIVLALSLTGCNAPSQGNGRQGTADRKPDVPLSLEILPERSPVPGELVSFEVLASSTIALPDLEITVKLAGMTLVDGTLEARGPVRAGEVRSLRFTIRVPEQGHHVITVTAATDHLGARFATRRQYLIGEPAGNGGAGANAKPAPREVDGVIEYELP